MAIPPSSQRRKGQRKQDAVLSALKKHGALDINGLVTATKFTRSECEHAARNLKREKLIEKPYKVEGHGNTLFYRVKQRKQTSLDV